LVEISKGTTADFFDHERKHIEQCERCAQLLAALFKLQKGEQPTN
jgi:hypothetical protein